MLCSASEGNQRIRPVVQSRISAAILGAVDVFATVNTSACASVFFYLVQQGYEDQEKIVKGEGEWYDFRGACCRDGVPPDALEEHASGLGLIIRDEEEDGQNLLYC